MHGFYWRIPLQPSILTLVHITAWETGAAAISILIASRVIGEGATLSANTDAALTPYALAHQRSKSKHVSVMLHLLLQLPEYQQATERLVVDHLSGEGNVGADLVSRGLWERFHDFVEAMRVKPTRLPLTALERDFVTRVLEEAASRKGTLLDARVLTSALDDGGRQDSSHILLTDASALDSSHERSLTLLEHGLAENDALLPAVHHPG